MVWREGVFVDEDDFVVSPVDRGLCHGLGLFETVLAVKGRLCLWEEHLERLGEGLERMGLLHEMDVSALEVAARELLVRNGLEGLDARLRVAVSGGVGALDAVNSGKAWMWMVAKELKGNTVFAEGVSVAFAPWRRNHLSRFSGLKTSDYAGHLMAMDWARTKGFDEAVFLNTAEEVCEAAMANVFLVRDGGLRTPSLDSGCLPGITRGLVMELASQAGIFCEEGRLDRFDLSEAEGMFLTSSIRGPVRVARFETRELGEDEVFPVIRRLWCEAMGVEEG